MKRRILVIDDETEVLDIVKGILENAGYVVHCDATGNDCLDLVTTFKPHLLMLDLNLGDADGKEICQAIKKNPLTASLPVIILSGALDIYNTILKQSANDIIEKPFTEEVLLARVRRQLEGSSKTWS